jgi:hypothetical protein
MSIEFEYEISDASSTLDFWIGLNDIDSEGVFVWDRPNGTTPQPVCVNNEL